MVGERSGVRRYRCGVGPARSYADRNGYTLGGCGDAVGQTNILPSLALVHAQKDAGATRRMIGGCVEQQKIRQIQLIQS